MNAFNGGNPTGSGILFPLLSTDHPGFASRHPGWDQLYIETPPLRHLSSLFPSRMTPAAEEGGHVCLVRARKTRVCFCVAAPSPLGKGGGQSAVAAARGTGLEVELRCGIPRDVPRPTNHRNHPAASRRRLEVEGGVAGFRAENPRWGRLGRPVPLGRRSQTRGIVGCGGGHRPEPPKPRVW